MIALSYLLDTEVAMYSGLTLAHKILLLFATLWHMHRSFKAYIYRDSNSDRVSQQCDITGLGKPKIYTV